MSEDDDGTAIPTPQVVEEIFTREGQLFEVLLAGRVLRTTPEHPFFVQGQGWTAAGELQPGNLVSTVTGEWLAVESVTDTHQSVTARDFRVSEYHTYFIASSDLAFDVWVHNACNPNASAEVRHLGEQFRARAEQLWGTLPYGKRYGATVAVSRTQGREVVSLYANVGRGKRQFLQSQIDDFVRSVEDAGGMAIHTSGSVHAEEALYKAFSDVPAIGISNPYGPCSRCENYFFESGRFFNIWWPDR